MAARPRRRSDPVADRGRCADPGSHASPVGAHSRAMAAQRSPRSLRRRRPKVPLTKNQQLLKDLKTQLGLLQDDLRERADDVSEFDQALRAEYAAASKARRTADTFETWREDPITQAAVAWVLGTVFVR